MISWWSGQPRKSRGGCKVWNQKRWSNFRKKKRETKERFAVETLRNRESKGRWFIGGKVLRKMRTTLWSLPLTKELRSESETTHFLVELLRQEELYNQKLSGGARVGTGATAGNILITNGERIAPPPPPPNIWTVKAVTSRGTCERKWWAKQFVSWLDGVIGKNEKRKRKW